MLRSGLQKCENGVSHPGYCQPDHVPIEARFEPQLPAFWYGLCPVVSGLLTLSAQAQIYRFGHCLFGCPEGSSGNQILVRSAYTLSYDEGRKSAVWAAYEVTPGSIGIASSLSRDLIRDDWVSESLTAADLAALAEQEYVRSQHVPLVSFAGTPYWREVNFASNATVRSRSLSQELGTGLTGRFEIW